MRWTGNAEVFKFAKYFHAMCSCTKQGLMRSEQRRKLIIAPQSFNSEVYRTKYKSSTSTNKSISSRTAVQYWLTQHWFMFLLSCFYQMFTFQSVPSDRHVSQTTTKLLAGIFCQITKYLRFWQFLKFQNGSV